MKRQTIREIHQAIAPLVFLPVLITVITGVTYRLSKDWFGATRDQVHFLMVIHEGEYFGEWGKSIYVLLNGLGVLWLLGTGIVMVVQNWRRSIWARWFKRLTQTPKPDTKQS
ncbi:MAG: PepSY domain-containing protein [Cyanobacteria bacterium P01_H01_bin.15]